MLSTPKLAFPVITKFQSFNTRKTQFQLKSPPTMEDSRCKLFLPGSSLSFFFSSKQPKIAPKKEKEEIFQAFNPTEDPFLSLSLSLLIFSSKKKKKRTCDPIQIRQTEEHACGCV